MSVSSVLNQLIGQPSRTLGVSPDLEAGLIAFCSPVIIDGSEYRSHG